MSEKKNYNKFNKNDSLVNFLQQAWFINGFFDFFLTFSIMKMNFDFTFKN